jgi:hypothetical protein
MRTFRRESTSLCVCRPSARYRRARKHSDLDRAEAALREPQPQAMTKLVSRGFTGVHGRVALGHLHHLLKLPARRGEAGPEPSHPRSSISTPSHSLHRRSASGRAIRCPCTNEISRRRHSDMYPRIWVSFRKQCHSPLDLRQNSLSVSPWGVASIGTRIYKNHHEMLDTSRRRTGHQVARKCHTAMVTGYSP